MTISKEINRTNDTTLKLNESMTELLSKLTEWKKQLKDQFKNKILIVDDDIYMLKCLYDIMKEELKDVTVEGVSNYEGAKGLINNHIWDMIIVDINLNDLDGRTGIDLVKEIRLDKKNSDLFIILMTGVYISELKKLAESSGSNYFMVKSMDFNEMVSIIKKCFVESI